MRSIVNLFLFIFPYVYTQDPVINLPQGRVVGIKVYAENSQTPVEIFFGIPYAAPPTGRLRFSPPERHTGWRRTLFAHRMPPRCPEPGDDYSIYNEDCLYLNIWTTRRVDNKLQPVVVIFYSESWARAGISLPCQELATEGLVVVTVSYRLNIFSFFTLQSIMARGNLGLLDQYMALLWIRENIASFGGDPASVTLLGHSAGADSVLLHIFSPRSIGLFHRAIIMSPSHKTLWKTIENDIKKNNVNLTGTISREVAETLGCGKNTDREILQCMKSLSLQDFAAFYSNPTWISALQPTSDTFLPESEQYMPLSLSMALAATKTVNIQLDLLMGFTNLETISLENKTYDINFKNGSYSLFGYTRNEIIPDILAMLSLEQSESIPLAINWEYFGANSRRLEKDLVKATESLSRMETSAKWGAGIALLAARLARRVSRLYVYRYLQPSRIDLNGRQINYTGAVHGADLLSLLGDALILQIARRPSTQEEKQISTRYRRYIVNFIKFGSPSNDGEWPRYVTGDSNIFDIYDKETTSTNANEINKEIAFWLQYLPQLSQSISSFRSEKIVSEKDTGRGGVFAMCGVIAVLILLLLISVIFLKRQSRFRFDVTENTN